MKKKHLNYLILIITILVGVLFTTKFSNVFGSDTDWINQHTVIPEYFRMLFYKTGRLLPNLVLAYGNFQNIYNFSYYGLLSPIILLSYFFPFLSMTNYITFINIIILIVSAILFYNFLEKHQIDNQINLTTSLLFILAAPFIFHMHRHIMFVNYMPFLIMSLMGVDSLLEKNKKTLLIISIFLMIMTSYYYSVGGIVVVGIYYLYAYLNKTPKFETKKFISHLFYFIFLILIAILMSGILLFPTLNTLLLGRGSSDTTTGLLSLLIPNLKFHKIFNGTYAIGLSLIGFIALLYLFYTKKKNNIIIGTIISLILFIPIFCYILNGGLYLREKCFIPFLPLCSYFIALFLKDLFNNKINIKKFIIYLLVILLPLYYFNQKSYCYYILVGFIIVLGLFKKFHLKKIVAIYLVIVSSIIFISESFGEDFVSIKKYQEIFNQESALVINDINNKDKTYYRTNNLEYPTKTINKVYNENYFTTNIYSSTYNKYYLDFVRETFDISMVDYNYFLVSGSYNLLFNSYMGVKYLYSPINPGLGYKNIGKNLYQNKLAYPLIYASDKLMSEKEFSKYAYPYSNELLMKNVIVDKDINDKEVDLTIKNEQISYQVLDYQGVSITKENQGYKLEVLKEGQIKLKLDTPLDNKILFITLAGLKENSCSYDNISMTINNISNVLTCKTWIYSNKNNVFNFVIAEEHLEELEIKLTKGIYNIENIETYTLDYEDVLTFNENIVPLNIKDIKNDVITGNITLEKDEYLVTSIPYDKGFIVKANGKKIETEIVNKAFLGVPLKAGSYEIEISYQAPGFKLGQFTSIIGFLLFISLEIIDYRKNKVCFTTKGDKK